MPTAFTRGADAIVVVRELGPTGPQGPTGATGATGGVALGTEIFFDNKAALEAATVASTTKTVGLTGFYAFGDGGDGRYKRVAAEPTHGLKIRSTDRIMPDGSTDVTNGGWWELVFDNRLHVLQAGAKWDGVQDETPFVQICVNAFAAAKGGTIILPHGRGICASTIDCEGKRVVFEGQGKYATQLVFTGTGSGRFLSFRTTARAGCRRMSILYTSASFTGTLVDFSHSAAGFDSAYAVLDDCIVGVDGPQRTARLLSLDKAILCTIRDTIFSGGWVEGQTSGGGSYSRDITFDSCRWEAYPGTAVVGVDSNWLFISCAWETSDSGVLRAVAQSGGTTCVSVTFINCTTDDTGADGGTGFTFIEGSKNINFLGGNYSGTVETDFLSATGTEGITIKGVFFRIFSVAIRLTDCDAVEIGGNDFTNFITLPLAITNIGPRHTIENNYPATANYRRAYLVSELPTANEHTGRILYCNNVRVLQSGGTIEGAGAGTGGHVTSDGSAWRVTGTNIAAAA